MVQNAKPSEGVVSPAPACDHTDSVPQEPTTATETRSSEFGELGLSSVLLKALHRLGHQTPTPVQRQAIPVVLAGHDLLVSAETGSGKTGAFLLPALQKLQSARPGPRSAPRILVLTPTRELAMQVEQSAQRYGGSFKKRLRTACLIGGAPFGPQLRQLAAGVDLVVATPGRLVDHIERGRIHLDGIELLILDEADRMLDMGFIDDIVGISEQLPENRQTVLFSATLDARIGAVAAQLTRNPQRLEVATRPDAGTLTQLVHHVDHLQHKLQLLDAILADSTLAQAVVFTGTKSATEELALRLRDHGRAAAALHGDMPQHARERVVRQLRSGRINVLVATDVAARGIDVPTISHVINFDLPMRPEDYIHRIGRTARAGRSGTSITLVGARDRRALAGIERLIAMPIPVGIIPGLEPRTPLKRPHRKPPQPSAHRGGPRPGARPQPVGATQRGQRSAAKPRTNRSLPRRQAA